jgi:hypothetical protein
MHPVFNAMEFSMIFDTLGNAQLYSGLSDIPAQVRKVILKVKLVY